MASINPPTYLAEDNRSPSQPRISLGEHVYEGSPRPSSHTNLDNLSLKNPLSALITNVKHLYSLNEQLQALESGSSPVFKWLLQANYLIRNGAILNNEDIRNILIKKKNLRTAQRSDLKLMAYQEISDHLAFVNHSNKVYLIRADTYDVFQSFDVMGVIQAIDFHPYKRLWLAIATKNQVKILHPESSEDLLLSSLNFTQNRDTSPTISKLERLLTLNIPCTSLEFSPDGRYLAMINEHSSVINIWDFDSKRLRSHTEFGLTFNKLKWSPDGAYLALSCDKAKKLCIFEVSTWQKQKWNLKAPITEMAWTTDTNTLFIFMKEIIEIRAVKDVQIEKCKTAYERREVEFRMAESYKLGIKYEDFYQIQNFAFCLEPDRLRYAYIVVIDGKEVTKLGIIEETNQEQICGIADDRAPVKAFFFMTKSGKFYEQKQPVISKCYSKDEIENIQL